MATHRRDVLRGGLAAAAATLLPRAALAQQRADVAADKSGSPAAGDVPVMPALCRYIAQARSAKLPDEIVALAKQHILDTLASIVACHDLKPAVVARRYALAQGTSTAGATLLGTRDKVPLVDAAMANAIMGHAAEINDFCPSAYVQPGPPVLCAALALAEQRKQSGAAVLQAVVAGYELSCRVPKALGNDNLRRAGLANHGVGPVFGAAAATASLLQLPEARLADVISYCVQQASGSWQWLLDIEHMEKAFVFAGMPARNGLTATLLVEAGFTGVANCLDAEGGWLTAEAYHGSRSDLDRQYLVKDLGQRFELPLVGFKRYPAGGPTQPGIQALLELIKVVDRMQVTGVSIAMPGRTAAFANAAMPALNLRYLTSIILLDGRLDFTAAQSLERMAQDEQVRKLMQNVEVRHDPAQERSPRVESARVTVMLADGTKQERFVEHVEGFPAHPMTQKQVEDKAIELMSPRLGQAGARKVIGLVAALEAQQGVGDLIASLIPA